MIKEIIFFSCGDSNDPTMWSNVPCRYSRTLEKKGYIIHRVNFGPSQKFITKYNNLVSRVSRLFRIGFVLPYSKSELRYYYGWPIIKRALKKYKNADLCIFMGSGMANFGDSRPCVIFCEDAYKKRIEESYHREPNFFEKIFIKREIAAWNKADLITILFPQDIETMKSLSPSINVKYRNGNVINSFYEGELDEAEILASKTKSNIILYVGGAHYHKGAEMTIEAFRLLKAKDDSLELHIIGMTAEMFKDLPSDVVCHGYLNKDDPQQNSEYYSLLLNAKVYINPTPRWGAYSSCIESMYFYNPIIVHPYKHFVVEFGNEIDFGCYNEDFTPQGVATSISNVIYSDKYLHMAKHAHDHVKEYTWDKYIDWTMEELNKVLTEKQNK